MSRVFTPVQGSSSSFSRQSKRKYSDDDNYVHSSSEDEGAATATTHSGRNSRASSVSSFSYSPHGPKRVKMAGYGSFLPSAQAISSSAGASSSRLVGPSNPPNPAMGRPRYIQRSSLPVPRSQDVKPKLEPHQSYASGSGAKQNGLNNPWPGEPYGNNTYNGAGDEAGPSFGGGVYHNEIGNLYAQSGFNMNYDEDGPVRNIDFAGPDRDARLVSVLCLLLEL